MKPHFAAFFLQTFKTPEKTWSRLHPFVTCVLVAVLQIGAVIVTPTRELAIQVDEVLTQFLTHLPDFTHMLLIGGNNPMLDVEKMQEHGYVFSVS